MLRHFSTFAFAAVLVAGAPVHAQPAAGTIRGDVNDLAGAPLPGSHVLVTGVARVAVVGDDGRFAIHVPPGTHTVVASSVGYRAARRRVDVTAGGSAEVRFTLEPVPADLGEIVVTARETLTGRGVRDVPGSAHYLSPQALARHGSGDVHRVLREIPGVNVQEEDGYGLRPNIGLRGSGVERSSRITLMEDGILIAPAPYAAPAAYYFPVMRRIDGVEVRTGASQVRYGPNTTGGALNLLAADIPTSPAVRAEALAGQNGQQAFHVRGGTTWSDLGGFGLGVVGEVLRDEATGFKSLQAPSGELLDDFDSGFGRSSSFGRVRVQSAPDARHFQSLTLSAGRTTEGSNETYLGLTDGDFAVTPFARYAGSMLDRMESEHTALRLRHVAILSSRVDLTTTVYRNAFARNWYKLDAVRDGAADDVIIANGDTTFADRAFGIAAILDRPAEHAGEFAAIVGNNELGRLDIRANNREYYSQGVQSVAGIRLGSPTRGALVELGFRVHGDGEDRFQWVDRHRFEGGALAIDLPGTPGTDANRVDRARAVAGFAQAEVMLGKWTVTPGVRIEHIALSREDFGRADPLRTGSSLTAQSNVVTAVIPGVGVLRRLSGRMEVFGGVHRGFAPPDSRDETRPESSINLEGGFRFAAPHASVQTAAYYAGYSNLLGSDLAATGGSGSGDRFNAGAVDVVGLEIAVNADLGAMAAVASWSFPTRAAYTFTRGTFRESFASTFADWGNVDAGDALPYLAPHQLTVAVGAERGRFRGDVIGGYVAAMRAEAGRGAIPDNQRIESHVVIDVAAEVSLPRGVAAFARIANILDETYLAARRPAGLRPGLPRTAVVGLRVGI